MSLRALHGRAQRRKMNQLFVKSIAGLLALLAVLAACLFVSAGTTDYWQAWLYLAVFALSTVLVTGYLMRYDQRLLASRVEAGPVAEGQKTQQVIQSLASLAFLGMLIVPGLDRRFGWSQVPGWLVWLSAALVALGFYAVFRVFRENTYSSLDNRQAKK
jgi:protein-S-isoprenylcysteine O-methyltransferase Ste14